MRKSTSGNKTAKTARAEGFTPMVRGAHASRVAMAASGCTAGGVEALGRFRRHSGSGARRQRGLEAAGCRRGRVRSLDGRRSCPQPAGNERCWARFGSLGTAGFLPFKTGIGTLARIRPPACRRVGRWPSSGESRKRFAFREVVGLGTGAAAPGMAHANLEACGYATAVWCYTIRRRAGSD